MPVTSLGHVAIHCRDLDESLAFYTTLGLHEAFRLDRQDGNGVELIALAGHGAPLIVLLPSEAEPTAAGHGTAGSPSCCLLVDDVQATYQDAMATGIPTTGEPKLGRDGNWQFWVADPDGTRIDIMQVMPFSRQAAAAAAQRPQEDVTPPRQVSAPPSVRLAPSFFAPSSETTLVWLGASGFVLNARGTLVLLDPVITYDPARPGYGETRHRLLVSLPIEASQVPQLDVVCYSHADGDHFGRRTARELVRTGALFVGPPPVARELTTVGVPEERQRVARIGQGFRVGEVDITPIRADHPWQLLNPARREPPFGPDDCCGYLLRTPDGTIFFPGDTRLVWDHYQLQDVDVLLLDVSNCPYHLGVENAAKLANKLGAPHIIAYHYGTYDAPNSVPQNGDPAVVAAKIEDAERRFHVLAPGALFKVRDGSVAHP